MPGPGSVCASVVKSRTLSTGVPAAGFETVLAVCNLQSVAAKGNRMGFSTQSLARSSALHPWRIVSTWGVIVILALAVTSQLFESAITTEDTFIGEPESAVAARLSEARLPGSEKITEFLIVASETLTV